MYETWRLSMRIGSIFFLFDWEITKKNKKNFLFRFGCQGDVEGRFQLSSVGFLKKNILHDANYLLLIDSS